MAEKDPFYVGYLPLPASIRRFIVPWLVGNIVLALGIAMVIAQQHREPGDGEWDTGNVVEIEGQIISDPYPILVGESGTYILVEQGKVGAQDRIAKLESKDAFTEKPINDYYTVRGYLIERAGRKVLEIDSSIDEPIVPWQTAHHALLSGDRFLHTYPEPAKPIDLGTHTLVGEIVDPKCYLGVMRPGDGKTHKVCATLCIKGGIPPMFLVRDRQGNTAAYLLTDAQGRAFPESHHEYIADPIELTGRVLRDGDLLILRADLGSIRRLEAGQ